MKRALALSPAKLAQLHANIFASAHSAISDWEAFPWHRDKRNEVQADKVHSSQALAIDVFGTILSADQKGRDSVLDALAVATGLPGGGPWRVELEWTDPDNLLREPRPTQVDAIAFGHNAIMVIECKFTEPGGPCSQTKRIASGQGAGQRQCNGHYERQQNPRSFVEASCTLSGKGIRYWDVIPSLFALVRAVMLPPSPSCV